MTSTKQLVYFSVLGGLALFTAIVLVGIYGDGRQATRVSHTAGKGGSGCATTCVLTITPSEVPLNSPSITISGSGFASNLDVIINTGMFPQPRVTTSTSGTFSIFYSPSGGFVYPGRASVQALRSSDLSVLATAFYTVCSTNPCGLVDTDGDGFTDTVEQYLGTDPNKACPSTTASNDEPVDAWPADFNDDGYFNIGDIGSFTNPARTSNDGHGTFNKFNHRIPDIGTDGQDHDPLIKRWDLVKDAQNIINIADLGAINPGITSSMTYPPMFNGESAFGKKCPTTP